jgi:hypothetical protein
MMTWCRSDDGPGTRLETELAEDVELESEENLSKVCELPLALYRGLVLVRRPRQEASSISLRAHRVTVLSGGACLDSSTISNSSCKLEARGILMPVRRQGCVRVYPVASSDREVFYFAWLPLGLYLNAHG